MTSRPEFSYRTALMELGAATAEYRPRFDQFQASLRTLARPRVGPSAALYVGIGDIVEFLAGSLKRLVEAHQRAAELRRDNRLAEMRKARSEILARVRELRAGANQRRRLLRAHPLLAGYWTPERQRQLLDALSEGDEAAAILQLAIKAYDPTIAPVDPSTMHAEEAVSALGREIPEHEWQRLPYDYNDNLDSYLYGHR